MTPFQQRFLECLEDEYGLRLFSGRNVRYVWYLLLGVVWLVVGAAVAKPGTHAMPVLPILLCGYAATQIAGMKREAKFLRQACLDWTPVPVVVVQANEGLFKKGQWDLPALVLFTFDRDFGANPAYMEHLAERMFALKNVEQSEEDLKAVAHMVTDERAVRYRRRMLPRSFTGGAVVYCADLWIKRSFLREGFITERFLPCLAQPGDQGGLELVPWQIAYRFSTPEA